MPVLTEIEPSEKDIDDIVHDLEKAWTATITVRRDGFYRIGL